VLVLLPTCILFTAKVFLKPNKPGNVYVRGPGFENTYAVSNQGQCRYCGVTTGGKTEFKRLLKLCKEGRAKEDTHTFEKDFLKAYQQGHGIIASSAEENKKAKRRKTNDQIAKESDDEEDDEEDEYSLAQESESSSVSDNDDGSDEDGDEEEVADDE